FDLESDELNAYSNDDLEVLMLLASQVAIIIEKVMLHEQLIEKKRLQGQLEVARQVQLELLPAHDPELPGYDISAYNFPTEEVSGDYYDWVRIYEDEIGIVIADVSGKGIPAALLMNANAEVKFIEYGEQPLGMFPRTRYHEYHLLLEPGDVLVLYTDGVTEALSPDGEEFGRDRVAQVVKENYTLPARELIASLQMAVLEWTANAGANDDVTFFVIKALK